MRQKLHLRWKRVPSGVRRPIVLTIGVLIVLLSGTVGWLPGPGGIPIFLLGVAILSSEFHWAQRFKLFILDSVHASGHWFRAHHIQGTLLLLSSLGISFFIAYMLFYSR